MNQVYAIDGPALLVQRTFEDMLLPLFAEGGARRGAGFHQVSRRIPDGSGWFFWLRDRPGAFLLELVEASPLTTADAPLQIYAAFSVKYYPSPQEPAFTGFSSAERQLRQSTLFDHTGTPAFATRERISPDHFSAGYLGAVVDPQRQLVLECASQDVLLHTAADGSRVRQVPGWLLTRELFSALLLGFAYCSRNAPQAVRLCRATGLELRETGGEPRPLERAEIFRWTLQAALSLEMGQAQLSGMVLPEGDGEVVFEGPAPPQVAENAPWIETDWWQAGSWTFPPDPHLQHCCFHDH